MSAAHALTTAAGLGHRLRPWRHEAAFRHTVCEDCGGALALYADGSVGGLALTRVCPRSDVAEFNPPVSAFPLPGVRVRHLRTESGSAWLLFGCTCLAVQDWREDEAAVHPCAHHVC